MTPEGAHLQPQQEPSLGLPRYSTGMLGAFATQLVQVWQAEHPKDLQARSPWRSKAQSVNHVPHEPQPAKTAKL